MYVHVSKSIHTLGQWTCLSVIPDLGQEVTTKSLYQIIPIEGAPPGGCVAAQSGCPW